MQLVCLGESQLYHLREAFLARQHRGEPGFELRTFIIVSEPYTPAARIEDGTVIFNEQLNEDLKRYFATADPGVLFTYLGGAEHALISLVNSPRPFDVLMPGERDAERSPGVEIIPYDQMAALCSFYVSPIGAWFSHLRSFTDRPIYQIGQPPPVFGDAHIRANADPIFQEQIERYGIAPHALRAKVWRICIEATAQLCAKHGVRLIVPPPEALGPEGCLSPGYRGRDAVHPNPAYGDLLLDRMIEIAGEFS